jgi:transcriptional regulator with XRE-family HTH domain
MDTLSSLGDFIRSQREAAEVSVRQLAKVAGVSNPYLSQVERGLRKPSAEVLGQIARALSMSAETLYVKAGLLGDDPEASAHPSPTETALRHDIALTPTQREFLLRAYTDFVELNRSKEQS